MRPGTSMLSLTARLNAVYEREPPASDHGRRVRIPESDGVPATLLGSDVIASRNAFGASQAGCVTLELERVAAV